MASLWNGPYEILAVDPCRHDNAVVGSILLLFDMMPYGPRTIARVSVLRCKRCHQPRAPDEMPAFLPWKRCSYELKRFAELAPTFYLTTDDVDIELDVSRARSIKIGAYRTRRGPSGTIEAQYKTDWKGLRKPAWEEEKVSPAVRRLSADVLVDRRGEPSKR